MLSGTHSEMSRGQLGVGVWSLGEMPYEDMGLLVNGGGMCLNPQDVQEGGGEGRCPLAVLC